MNAFVLGAGGWGTALAMLLHSNGHAVTLFSHRADKAETLSRTRENPLLPGASLPDGLEIVSDPEMLSCSDMAVFAVPSFAVRGAARQASPLLRPDCLLVSAAKGFEKGSLLRMSQILAEECGSKREIAVLSGPSHAEEVCRALPTGCVAASPCEKSALTVQRAFMNETFRVYTHDDPIGVETAGALKNVAALCCGICDGLGLGDNAKALLITRSQSEISRLCEKLGGRRDTLAGLAGMGDLIVTCTSPHSRNRRAGILIGQGCPPTEAVERVGGVVEGYYAAACAYSLAEQCGVDMPISRGVYRVLYEKESAPDMVHSLMTRPARKENDSCWI